MLVISTELAKTAGPTQRMEPVTVCALCTVVGPQESSVPAIVVLPFVANTLKLLELTLKFPTTLALL